MPKKYKVTLTSEERQSLQQMVRSGRTPTRPLTRARVLLKADCGEGRVGWTDEQIGEALDVGRATIERIRQRFVEESFSERGRVRARSGSVGGDAQRQRGES